MLYGKRFGLLQQDVEEESLNFIKAVKTVWKGLSWGWGEFFFPLAVKERQKFKGGSWKKQLRFLCWASKRCPADPGVLLLCGMPQPGREYPEGPAG